MTEKTQNEYTLKLDENGNAVLKEGKPVYLLSDGREIAFDVNQSMSKISALNAEAKGHRMDKENALKELKALNDVLNGQDVSEIVKALELVKGLNEHSLLKADDVAKKQAETAKSYELKLQDSNSKAEKLLKQLQGEIVKNAFNRSKFVNEQMAIPAEMVQAFFGSHFSVDENGQITATDSKGNAIYSRVNVGELATFDEALAELVGNYSQKERILKGAMSSGSGLGSMSGNSVGVSGAKSLSDCKTDAEKIAYLQSKTA